MGGKSGDSSSQRLQIAANAETLALIKEQTAQGRQDVKQLFGSAQQNLLTGQQRALDIFGQTIPQQLDTFQQGNVAAQEQLIAGLPQVQNALLGLPTDLSGFQPTKIDFDASFAQQQLPQFQNPQLTNIAPPPVLGGDTQPQQLPAEIQAAIKTQIEQATRDIFTNPGEAKPSVGSRKGRVF